MQDGGDGDELLEEITNNSSTTNNVIKPPQVLFSSLPQFAFYVDFHLRLSTRMIEENNPGEKDIIHAKKE
eukprot:Pgem_evm2s9039